MYRRSFAVVVMLWVVSSSALAQVAADATPDSPSPAAPPPEAASADVNAAAPTSLPDVVRLTNGGLVRGLIEVSLPGQYVEIRTSTGELMRFASTEVSYAGPAAAERSRQVSEPERAAPSIALTPSAPVKLESARKGATFYLADEAEHFEPLCTAPCERVLEPGPTTFALSVSGRTPALAEPVSVVPGGTYYGEFASRRGVRIAGGLILAASLATAIPLIAVGANASTDCTADSSTPGVDCTDGPDPALIVPGVVVGLAGIVTGMIMLTRRDRATIWQAR